MLIRFAMTAFLFVAGAHCASAGMIVHEANTPAIIAGEEVMPWPDDCDPPLRVERGATLGMTTTVVSSGTTASASVCICISVATTAREPLRWRLRLANSRLPAKPLLSEPLKPA